MTLGEKLKESRKKSGLSQEQLSEKLGVSRSAVAKWETDNGIPDVDNQVYMPEQSVVSGESKKAVAKRVTKLKKLGS